MRSTLVVVSLFLCNIYIAVMYMIIVVEMLNLVSAHRNEHLATSLRCFRNDLKAKEPQSEKKRRKGPRKDDKATVAPVLHIPDS